MNAKDINHIEKLIWLFSPVLGSSGDLNLLSQVYVLISGAALAYLANISRSVMPYCSHGDRLSFIVSVTEPEPPELFNLAEPELSHLLRDYDAGPAHAQDQRGGPPSVCCHLLWI